MWEYKVEYVGSFFSIKVEKIEKLLNELGFEGWELVATASHGTAGTSFYFKRFKK